MGAPGEDDPVEGRLGRAARGALAATPARSPLSVVPRDRYPPSASASPGRHQQCDLAARDDAATPRPGATPSSGAVWRSDPAHHHVADAAPVIIPVATPHRTITGEAATRGPAYERLLRHSNHLAKRVTAAHAHLHKAFSSGAGAPYMTTTLRLKSGQHALRCVAEAMPLADSLLSAWDDAWGSQMHHLSLRAESAEAEMAKSAETTERAIAEAEAYRAETEAYRAEMDLNVDRIARAAAIEDEKKELAAKLEACAPLPAALAAAEALAASATREAERATAAAKREVERMTAELDEARATCDAAEEYAQTARGSLAERDAQLAETKKALAAREGEAKRVAAELKTAVDAAALSAAAEQEARRGMDVARAEVAPLREALEGEREGRKGAERLAADAAETRRDAERRASDAEAHAQEWEIRTTSLHAQMVSAEETIRNLERKLKDAHADAANKQLELSEKIIALEDELRATRKGAAEAYSAAANSAKLGPEIATMEETSRRLRQDLAAAERVRFAAQMVAGKTEVTIAEAAAMEFDDAAMDEVAMSRGGRLVADLSSQMAAMRDELAALKNHAPPPRSPRTSRGAASAISRGATPRASASFNHGPMSGRTSPALSASGGGLGVAEVGVAAEIGVAAEMETLRRRLAEANAHVASLASERERLGIGHGRAGGGGAGGYGTPATGGVGANALLAPPPTYYGGFFDRALSEAGKVMQSAEARNADAVGKVTSYGARGDDRAAAKKAAKSSWGKAVEGTTTRAKSPRPSTGSTTPRGRSKSPTVK